MVASSSGEQCGQPTATASTGISANSRLISAASTGIVSSPSGDSVDLLPRCYTLDMVQATAPVAAMAAPSAFEPLAVRADSPEERDPVAHKFADMVPECPVLRDAHRSCRGGDVDDNAGPPVFREVQAVAGRSPRKGGGKGAGPPSRLVRAPITELA